MTTRMGVPSTAGEYQLSSFGARTGAKMLSGTTLVIRDLDEELKGPGELEAFRAIGIAAII